MSDQYRWLVLSAGRKRIVLEGRREINVSWLKVSREL
jgi:hypothetical protein